MTALKCDRCGKLYEQSYPEPIYEIGVSHPDSNEYYRTHGARREYDLCPECRKSLWTWMTEAE